MFTDHQIITGPVYDFPRRACQGYLYKTKTQCSTVLHPRIMLSVQLSHTLSRTIITSAVAWAAATGAPA